MKRLVNQKEFISRVADVMEVTKKSVAEVLEVMETVLYEELATASAEESVEVKMVRGINILAKHVDERTGYNPQTGEQIIIPAKIKINAKVGNQLKDYVNS